MLKRIFDALLTYVVRHRMLDETELKVIREISFQNERDIFLKGTYWTIERAPGGLVENIYTPKPDGTFHQYSRFHCKEEYEQFLEMNHCSVVTS